MCALICAFTAASAERGFPLITVYHAEVHKAGPQTFEIAQDRSGVLYFGNLHGLLTYDGAWWRLLPLPDDQLALSVASDDRGRVMAGLVNDFGYVAPDAQGTPAYHSLLPKVAKDQREFGDVRAICPTPAGFLFVAETALFVWDGNAVRFAGANDRETGPRECYAEGSNILLHGPNGLQRFDLQTFRLSPSMIAGRVDAVVRRGQTFLVAVRDQGLFVLSGTQSTPFAPEAAEWLRGKLVYDFALLADGRIVIATRQHGILVVDGNGAVEQTITDESGLPDSVINDIHVDREGSLWLAMEGPIARIDVASRVSIFDARRELKGSIGDITRFNGHLYVATTHGLHRIDERGAVQRIEGIRDAWRVIPFDDQLIIGTARGLYSLREGGVPEHFVQREGELYDLTRSRRDPSRIWIAQRHGLSSVRRSGDTWVYEEAIPGVPEYAASVIEHDGAVWLGTTFDGVVRVTDPRGPSQRVTQFGIGETNVFEAGGRVVAVHASSSEVQSVDRNDKLVRDPLLGHISAPRGFFGLVEDARGDIWINSTPPRVFARRAGGTYAREGKPLVGVTAADIQTLRAHPDGVVWFASDKGLFRYEPSQTEEAAVAQLAPLIRRVLAADDRVLSESKPLRHNFGRMRVEFAPASFRPGVEYQYRLDPIDTEWSQWTAQPFIDYTTLEANDYTFRLRARGPSLVPSSETTWSFSVLPPWYRTRWAYALWALLAGAAILSVIRVRTASLRRQAEKLRQRVEEKTAELQETVQLLEQANSRLEILSMEDDLTGIANRRFFERALTDEWNRARRRETPLALILLDLDHFKELNDFRGHPAGDDALRRIGAFLADTIRRSGEVVARYGGEEFAILLPGVDGDGAVRVAEALRDGIERLAISYGNGGGRRMTASCGVAAITPAPEAAPEHLVASADRALYAAKHSGRNCVRIADETTTGTWLRDASA
ncbi:MAG TPA: diguanylate cyclase [Thermoanaerobaculia bacterium]|nr:diguanylate cyclase [Thermoanaerobaculia bacterium]